MENEIKNLKASLEVVRDYAKEAENLVTQINKETENIRKEYDLTLPQIKDMIHEDMHVLKEFSNPKYPDTTRLTVCVGQENGLHFKAYILLSDEGEYKKAIKKQISWSWGGIPSSDVLYADGAFAGESANPKMDAELQLLCENWPDVLRQAYEKMLKAYKKNVTSDLQKAVAQKERIYQKYCCLKAVCDSVNTTD